MDKALERHNQEILEERRIMELSKKRKKMAGYYEHKRHYDKLIEQKNSIVSLWKYLMNQFERSKKL